MKLLGLGRELEGCEGEDRRKGLSTRWQESAAGGEWLRRLGSHMSRPLLWEYEINLNITRGGALHCPVLERPASRRIS